jgi:hypothetical protein
LAAHKPAHGHGHYHAHGGPDFFLATEVTQGPLSSPHYTHIKRSPNHQNHVAQSATKFSPRSRGTCLDDLAGDQFVICDLAVLKVEDLKEKKERAGKKIKRRKRKEKEKRKRRKRKRDQGKMLLYWRLFIFLVFWEGVCWCYVLCAILDTLEMEVRGICLASWGVGGSAHVRVHVHHR